MRFWDSSALVTLHVHQSRSAKTRALYADDPQILAWTLSDVEIASALSRLQRDESLSLDEVRTVLRQVETFWETVHLVSVVRPVKARAKRLLGLHDLRAADALQLAAALVAARDDPTGWEFVCLDRRLSEAAQREGFAVRP